MKVDVRVIAATNQPLETAVAERRFREDLFYRLNVVRIHLPPLRERRGDIRLLVDFFLRKIAKVQKTAPKSIAEEALLLLERYHWPGNVRELENVIHRATVVAKSHAILPADLAAEVAGSAAVGAPAPSLSPAPGAPVSFASPIPSSSAQHLAPGARPPAAIAAAAMAANANAHANTSAAGSLESPSDMAAMAGVLFQWARKDPKLRVLPAVERELVIHALRETKGNQVQAARVLGITRATLRKRMEKFGIRPELSFQ